MGYRICEDKRVLLPQMVRQRATAPAARQRHRVNVLAREHTPRQLSLLAEAS